MLLSLTSQGSAVRVAALSFVVSALSSSAWGELSVSREGAIDFAFANNRQLAVAEAEIDRATTALRWAGRLDNPALELSYTNDVLGQSDDEDRFEIGFHQAFPITGRLRREKELQASQVAIAEAEVAVFRQALAARVDAAYVEAAAAEGLIGRQDGLALVHRETLDFLRIQFDQGRVSPFDLTQAELALRALEQEGQLLRSRSSALAGRLRQLIGLSPDEEIQIAPLAPLPEVAPAGRADLEGLLEGRSDYRMALARIDEADAGIALERSKRWEDVSVGVIGERERSAGLGGLEHNSFLGLGVSVPLPIWQRNQAGVDGAGIDRQIAADSVEAVRFEILSGYELAYLDREFAWEMAKDASGEVVELARQNFDESKEAYGLGQADFRQIQQAQRQLIEIEKAALEAVAEYHRAAVRLRAAAGDYPSAPRIVDAPQK